MSLTDRADDSRREKYFNNSTNTCKKKLMPKAMGKSLMVPEYKRWHNPLRSTVICKLSDNIATKSQLIETLTVSIKWTENLISQI